MNAKKTPDQRFLDAQIALLMGTPEAELDELLQAVDLEGSHLASRGTVAIDRALAAVDSANQTSNALTSLPIPRQREVAARLGIRRSVFTALAEHRAVVESIPKSFLRRFAKEVDATLEAVTLALSGPVRVAIAQHKSNQAPELPKRVKFEQLLRDASMTEAEIAELMREDS